MNVAEFNAAVDKLKSGGTITYHQGFLMADRCHSSKLDALADAARFAYEDGKVWLRQRKNQFGLYDYWVVRR